MSLRAAAHSALSVRGTDGGSNITSRPVSRAASASRTVDGVALSKNRASNWSIDCISASARRLDTTASFGSRVRQAGHSKVNLCAPSEVPRITSTMPGVRTWESFSIWDVSTPAFERNWRRRVPRWSSPTRARIVVSNPKEEANMETFPLVPPAACQ